MTEERIGIYAGKGVLPIKVAESITKSNKEVFIIAIKGLTDKNIEKFPHQWLRFGQIGLAMNMLKKNNCNELVIIGGARIPNFFFLFPDFFGLKLNLNGKLKLFSSASGISLKSFFNSSFFFK